MALSVDQLAKPLRVQKKIQETSDAVTLALEIPPELKSQFKYSAGQFVTFFLNLGGETLARSYSLCTSPLVDKDFKVSVKKVPGGRASTYLCDVAKEGDVLMTTPPAGHFFKQKQLETPAHYFLFAAGSGITPVHSILKTVLASSKENHVTLVYCNRNESSIILRESIESLAMEYGERLNVVHVLSRPESQVSTGPVGRLQKSVVTQLKEMIPARQKKVEHYLCGPTEFMNLIREALLESGFSKETIHEENFGDTIVKPASALNSSSEATPIATGGVIEVKPEWTVIGDLSAANEKPEKIIALINGETVEVAAKEDQSILETLLESGAQPPYSCMDGACMACLGKVEQGKVYQKDPGILSDDNVAARETLTCQARPLTKIVKVNYDNL
jgi:ring-1,2-phenylacetyl-CoA epoxidase subunit PaaE